MRSIQIVRGDITAETTDAIVNAANSSLLGGGGVDGAIHRAAGPELLAYCRTLGGCETGSAVITPGFNLAAKWIIHAVGPIWQGGQRGEPEMLAGCYREALRLAELADCASISFPCISTGIYGYPFEDAARVALATITEGLTRSFLDVRLVCFSEKDQAAYVAIAEEFGLAALLEGE